MGCRAWKRGSKQESSHWWSSSTLFDLVLEEGEAHSHSRALGIAPCPTSIPKALDNCAKPAQGCSYKPQSYANPPGLLPSSHDPKGGEAALWDHWRWSGNPTGCKEGGGVILPSSKQERNQREKMGAHRAPHWSPPAAFGGSIGTGWWQVQEPAGVPVLIPAHQRDQPAAPQSNPSQGLTNPIPPFPSSLPPAQEGPGDGSSLGKQHIPNQAFRPSLHHRHTWRDSSLCYSNPLNASSKPGEGHGSLYRGSAL